MTTYKKPLLYALIISVMLGAVLGIVFVLRNTWGWFEVRVMLTTVIIAAASLCGLACDLSRLPFGINALPRSGLMLTLLATAMLLLGMWLEFESKVFWKMAIIVSIFAIATVHVCLLSIARLVGRYRWVAFVANQLIYGLATVIAVAIVGEIDSEAMWRFIAALSIVVAAITLIVPLLYRIGRMEAHRRELLTPLGQRNIASIEQEIERLRERIEQLQEIRAAIIDQTATGGKREPS